jgi:hypothetical protein
MVSNENRLLSSWGGSYLPFNRMDSKLEYDPTKRVGNRSYVITGDYDTFCLNVKSLLMMHRFDDPKPKIMFCRAIDILHKFYVKQSDGTSPHISDTDEFSLIIACLDTQEKNDQLKTVLSQVAHTRNRDKKPVWFFIPPDRKVLSNCPQEYSPELEKLIKGYKAVEIAALASKKSQVVTKDEASSFEGFSG